MLILIGRFSKTNFCSLSQIVKVLSIVLSTLYMTNSSAEITSWEFPAQEESALHADVVFTQIELDSHEKDFVEVKLERTVLRRFIADERKILEDHEVTVEEKGQDVDIKISIDRTVLSQWQRDYKQTPLTSQLYVRVPSSYNINLESVSGRIDVGKIDGTVKVSSVSGQVNVAVANQEATISTVSGWVDIESGGGDATVSSVSGSIQIGQIEGDLVTSNISGKTKVGLVGGEFTGSSISGAITSDEIAGEVALKTTSGAIRINRLHTDAKLKSISGSLAIGLPAETGYDFDLKTMSGKITTDFVVQGDIKRRHIKGQVNGGGDTISLNSVSGNLIVSEDHR